MCCRLKGIHAIVCITIVFLIGAKFGSGYSLFRRPPVWQVPSQVFASVSPPESSDGTNAFTSKTPSPSTSRKEIELNENDIEESFTKGSGNGGQKINTTANRVVLVHKPTGIKVSCQDARDLYTNRKWARDMLKEKLDVLYNGAQSKAAIKHAEEKRRKKDAARKSKKKYSTLAAKRAAEEQTNSEENDLKQS